MELTVILGDVGFKSQLKIYIILKQILSVCSHRHLPIWFLQTNTELFFFGWWRWGRGTYTVAISGFFLPYYPADAVLCEGGWCEQT